MTLLSHYHTITLLHFYFFPVFKCKELIPRNALYANSPSLYVLQQDFRVTCFSTDHMPYVTLAFVALVVYVFAIPLMLFWLLKKANDQNFLFDETKGDDFKETKASYGSLYLQYENHYWWWELTVMVKKMFLTGAMVIISPGTSFQLLIGLLLAILYMLAVLKAGT